MRRHVRRGRQPRWISRVSRAEAPLKPFPPLSWPKSTKTRVTGEVVVAAEMVADRGKTSKVAERDVEENNDHVDGDLVLSIEKLQEIQDELEKVTVA
ncbi:hypothetical protein QJS10_CPB17g01282 [Acorus calamus]|uniref:Uncharacterized protein n=1 Tax=Acorus calamus TaxID=4465 RepID=A0AAV9CWQ4_ACOCL|nr:hypothetical protein QJS10_CPB17g01282 [Acorus calamus]